jgi:hypothetical protein
MTDLRDAQERLDKWTDDDAPPAEIVPLDVYADVPAANAPVRSAAPTASTRVPPIDWTSLVGDPPPRTWWIQDWLGPWPTLVAGAGGAGKTRLMQMVGTSLATGRRYLETSVRPLNVLMWLCEDTKDEVWRLQASINAHFSLSMEDLKSLHVVPRQGFDNTLLDLAFGRPTFTPLLGELAEQVNDLKIDVLVLDNIAQVYGGSVDPHQTTQFVNGIAGMVRGRHFAPVLLGHVARAAGSEFAGSAAWENSMRMRWYLGPTLPDQKPDDSEPVESDVVYLARRKANYVAKDWRRLRFQNGLLIPDEPEDGQRFDQTFRNDAAERVLLEALPRLVAAGVLPTDGKTAGDYLPAQIVKKGFNGGQTKKDLEAAMHRLMGAGRLRRDVVGKYANRAPRYGLVAA